MSILAWTAPAAGQKLEERPLVLPEPGAGEIRRSVELSFRKALAEEHKQQKKEP